MAWTSALDNGHVYADDNAMHEGGVPDATGSIRENRRQSACLVIEAVNAQAWPP
jgi:hypothetical protein